VAAPGGMVWASLGVEDIAYGVYNMGPILYVSVSERGNKSHVLRTPKPLCTHKLVGNSMIENIILRIIINLKVKISNY